MLKWTKFDFNYASKMNPSPFDTVSSPAQNGSTIVTTAEILMEWDHLFVDHNIIWQSVPHIIRTIAGEEKVSSKAIL